MSDEPEISKARMIPLHVADQAVRALEEEILRLRAELERTQAQVKLYRSRWIRSRAEVEEGQSE
jgi:uncharacterized small protein (DUF1192 family)